MGAMPGRYTVAAVFTGVEAWSKEEASEKVENALTRATEDDEASPLAVTGTVVVSVTTTREPE